MTTSAISLRAWLKGSAEKVLGRAYEVWFLPVPGHRKVVRVQSVAPDYWVTSGRPGDWCTESWCCHADTLVYGIKAEAEKAL